MLMATIPDYSSDKKKEETVEESDGFDPSILKYLKK
jgi:hypothetical protein